MQPHAEKVEKMAKQVKLADIAAIMNVSTVTVSKALSDQKGVSEEMREKIKKLAQEMGYRSPSAAKMLKTKKNYNIGILISERLFNQEVDKPLKDLSLSVAYSSGEVCDFEFTGIRDIGNPGKCKSYKLRNNKN